MQIKLQVLKEDSRVKDGIEYLTITGLEVAEKPLLQMLDYSLRPDEKEANKGKLLGKVVTVQVENIRAIFAGRPQCSGTIVAVAVGAK